MSGITTTSTYYITTAATTQAAVTFTLSQESPTEYTVKTDVYNGDPATTDPVFTKTQHLSEDQIINYGNTPLSAGEVLLWGSFSRQGGGLIFQGGLDSAYASTRIHGIIGAYSGGSPDLSKPFEFAKGNNYPSETCNVELSLAWDESRHDYNVNWSFEGASGSVELTNGSGSISYSENGVTISGTFHEDMLYKFTGQFIKSDVLQLGFDNAAYAGWIETPHHIR